MHNTNPLPKKSLREKFHAAKLDKKVNELLSAAYLLHSVAYCFYDEADEVLKEHGIKIAQTKELNIKLRRAYNAYFRDFAELIERTDAEHKDPKDRVCKRNYYADLDRYTPILRSLIRHVFAHDVDEVKAEFEIIGIKTEEK